MGPIVLLTDFGEADWFAGVLKGVIAGIAPAAAVIDLTHQVPPGDVRAGAFGLWAGFRHFPAGAIFVAVVDPGVGSARAALLVSAHGRHFLGPDNGLLSLAASGDPARKIRGLENPRYRLAEVGATFHGRDIFAPAAAHLHRGARPAAFGRARAAMVELPPLRARRTPRGLVGEIAHIDRFGNALTTLSAADLAGMGPAAAARCRGKAFPRAGHYAEAGPGRPLSLLGSCGLLELSVRDGSAAARFSLRVGDEVAVGPAAARGGRVFLS